MATQAIIPQPTGNPILDNPTLKAAFMASQGGAQQPPQPQGATMPPAGQQPPAQISLPDAPMPTLAPAKQPVVFGPFGQKSGPVAQRGTREGDKQERERELSTGSGLSQIHSRIESAMPNHPVLGKVLGIGAQGLATLGDIGLRTVSPIAESMIPGTAGHHAAQLRQVNQALTQDETNAEKEAQTSLQGAQTGHLQEETAELPAEAQSREGLQGAQQNNLENPAWEQFETDQGIFARNPKTNELMPLTFQGKPLMPKPPTPKGQEHVSLEGPGGKPIAANYHPDTGKYTDASGNEIANPKPYEKPNVPNVNAGGEKAFEYSDKALTSLSTPISQIQMRMGRLKDTLAQGTPQADALAAPELLTIMAGGQGSGLRMNEAEISRIVGGRSHWEALRAAAQKWSLNPETANSITADQRQQIRALVSTVDAKLIQKQNILNDAGQKLLDAKSPEEQHRVIIEARTALTQIDAGGNQPAQGGAPQRPASVPAGYNWNPQGNGGKGSWQPPKQ